MASSIWTTLYLSVGGTDISSYVESFEWSEGVEIQDDTTFGKTYRVRKTGLKDWSAQVTLHQDWAAGLLDAIIAPLNGTTVAVEFRPSSAVVGTGNPKRTGNAVLSYDSPVSGGQVGTLAKNSFTLHGSDTLTRATA